MGGQVGGFHNSLSEYIITHDGIINENFFQIINRETELINNLELSHCKIKSPISGKIEQFLGLILKSKYDGTPGIREPIDICITLDISGSMSCGIGEQQNDSKTRNDLSVEAIIKLTEQLNDEDGIAINTFDEISHNIVPFTLKKFLTQKNIEDIKKIHPTGNENIYNALEGAMQQLLESTKKNKRIILITDLWAHDDDLKDFKNLFKKCVYEDQIEVTIIGISQDANSHLAKVVAYERGCNYYNVLESKDLEKYLVNQFNYICFPYSFDIKIKFNSKNLKVVETIGVGDKKIEGNNIDICDIGSSVPSELKIINGKIYMEGGLILLKLEKQNENNSIDFNCELVLEYFDRNNQKYEQVYKYEVEKEEYKGDYFSCKTIEHGMALYYYTKMCSNLLNYKNAYNQITFINLNQRGTQENIMELQNQEAKYKKYHDNILLGKVIEFFTIHYSEVEGLISHSERYIEKINKAFHLDTPKRYQGD